MDVSLLRRRADIVRAVRAFFDARGFVEVETPVRLAAPAPEPHIDCPPVATGGFLRASPELQMKKLLAAGLDRIYQIGPCFRDGERGSRHSPEFTMLEWYRLNATYREIQSDLVELLTGLTEFSRVERVEHKEALQGSTRSTRLITRQKSCESCQNPVNPVKKGFTVLTVREAYRRFALWDPWEGAWDGDRFDFDMATKIEPALKQMGGVFLTDYPPPCASLAKVTDGGATGRIAERWEFYWNGLELANCFTELCDGAEQRRRFEAARAERRVLGEVDYPLDEEFLSALDTLGSAAGVALGIDRLVMALTDTRDISTLRAPC